MNEVDDKYQQQILFTEDSTILNESDEKQNQIVVNNQDWQPDDKIIESLEDRPEMPKKPRWLWRTIGVLFSGIVAIEGYNFFVQGFEQSPIITGLYAGLLGCVSVVAGASLLRELSGLKQFRKQQDVQASAKALIDISENENLNSEEPVTPSTKVTELCASITQALPCDLVEEQELQWQAIDEQQYTDAEVLELYSRVVLSKVDQKAVAEIAKYSSESVVLIALSPVALLDMVIMLWRNLKMIDKIAGLYGLKLGYWSRIKLIRQVFVNMVYAGASELVADFGADMIGADMLGKLSGRLAQGLGAGLLTARLGLKTLKLCRPIPFNNDAPNLGQVRSKMLEQIKALSIKTK